VTSLSDLYLNSLQSYATHRVGNMMMVVQADRENVFHLLYAMRRNQIVIKTQNFRQVKRGLSQKK
jgi:hypothetical protein